MTSKTNVFCISMLQTNANLQKTLCKLNRELIEKIMRRIQILAGELSLSAVTVVAVVDEEPASKRRKDSSLEGG